MTNKFTRAAFAFLFISTFFVCVAAQTPAARDASQTAPAPTPRTVSAEARTSVDESFELNISERRIAEENFEASTEVEIGREAGHGLALRVGVAVGAERIELLLRNVRGSVRFRATLEPVLRLFSNRRTAAPPPP